METLVRNLKLLWKSDRMLAEIRLKLVAQKIILFVLAGLIDVSTFLLTSIPSKRLAARNILIVRVAKPCRQSQNRLITARLMTARTGSIRLTQETTSENKSFNI